MASPGGCAEFAVRATALGSRARVWPRDYHCLLRNVHAAGAHAGKRSLHRIEGGFIAPLARDPFPAFPANAIGPCAHHQKRYFLPAIKP
jgi:hypothetical protein